MSQSVLLINPNSTECTTQLMVGIARDTASTIEIEGATATGGPPLITNEAELAMAAIAVCQIPVPAHFQGIIVAAFGDPGRNALAKRMKVPVVGIAEAGMRLAAEGGRRFSVATTTPGLVRAIERRASLLGFGDQLASVRLTEGPLEAVMSDPCLMHTALAKAITLAVEEDGAEAVIIGGGPLAAAARHLAPTSPVPLIEPLPAAVAEIERALSC